VQDKKEIFDDYLQRRVNVIKAYIGMFNNTLIQDCDAIEIEPEITPYILANEIDELDYWMKANGEKPVISQEESIEKAGLSSNVKDTFAKIQAENEAKGYVNSFEPTI
jgi:hypothetical protein